MHPGKGGGKLRLFSRAGKSFPQPWFRYSLLPMAAGKRWTRDELLICLPVGQSRLPADPGREERYCPSDSGNNGGESAIN
jgi:hypothetical protein